MTIRNFSYSLAILSLFVFAGTAAAQGPSAGSSTTSNLEMTAEVQTAVQLNISTGSGGVSVGGSNSTGLFTLDFGNVNGLGVGAPATGVTVSINGTGALYKTPINISPVFSGFGAETADVTVEAGSSGNEDLAREGASLSGSGGTAPSSTPSVALTDVANGSSNQRYVGFYIPRTEVAGSKTATLIYSVSVAF